ncbi:hypothetical protein [Actinomadura litoris]|uniref:Uncharacterized protein n=1 Tax=Actinomadura litoris TaxID=2678616 RepID=A0A7K1LAP0_9ACTN|nr:hypothetical protein [Actinomadura litoris]MUN41383.1 hypothetical protein [Actinomadura litoris]
MYKLELEQDGRVSWVLWEDGHDCGGNTYEDRGQEVLDREAQRFLDQGWLEICSCGRAPSGELVHLRPRDCS